MSVNARPTAKNYVNPSYQKSDHPSFRDKKHTLLIDAQGASNKSIKTESGTLRFENGVAVLPDDSRAKDIYDEIQKTQARHPQQYALVQDKPTVNVDETHRYTFGSHPAMPWARYDELGRRLPDLETEDTDDESTEQRTGASDPKRGAGEV